MGCPAQGWLSGHLMCDKKSLSTALNSKLCCSLWSSKSTYTPPSSSIGSIWSTKFKYVVPPSPKKLTLPSHLPSLTAGRCLAYGISYLNLLDNLFLHSRLRFSNFTLTSSLITSLQLLILYLFYRVIMPIPTARLMITIIQLFWKIFKQSFEIVSAGGIVSTSQCYQGSPWFYLALDQCPWYPVPYEDNLCGVIYELELFAHLV